MKEFGLRSVRWFVLVVAMAWLASPLSAEQSAGNPAAPQVPTQAQQPPSLSTETPTVQPSPAPTQAAAPDADNKTSMPVAVGDHARELSPWSMFLSADNLVKAVMISLAFASLVTWTIFLAKTVQISHAKRTLGAALARIADIRSLAEAQVALGSRSSVLSALLAAATHEIRMSADSPGETGIRERAASRFSEIVRMEARAIRYGMGPVATIGATAPFVGLFGTVWGIMNSFIGISNAHTTNLAVVAPGIAEALLATAVGLAAAIPAVIIYNHFSRATKSYLDLVARASGAIGRLLSRDLDRFQSGAIARAAE